MVLDPRDPKCCQAPQCNTVNVQVIYACLLYFRCPTYNLQPGCIMVPDPRDPKCCQAPQCNTVNVTGVTGAITGIGTTPIPTPGPGRLLMLINPCFNPYHAKSP